MPQVVGLDIGAKSVKAALFERGFRGLELTGYHKLDVDGGDPESLGRVLGEMSARFSPNATVVARLPGDRVLLRMMELPIADARKLEQVIPFELEQVIPYELDDLVLDHSLLKRTDTGTRVLVAAARKEEVRETLEKLAARNVEPRFLGAGPSVLASLVAAVPALGQGTVAIVDAGFARTDVCVLEQGRVAYARTISAGWADMGPSADAPDVGDPGLSEITAHAAADFVAREVRRTLLSAETEANTFAERIVLAGGLAKVRGFAALLERTTQLLVEPLALSGSDWAKSALPATAESEAAAAVALAFRVVADAPAAGVNFRKDEFAFKRDTKELSGVILRMSAVAAGLLLLALVHYGVKAWLLGHERAALDKQIAEEVLAAFPDVPRSRLTDPDTALSIMKGNVADTKDRLAQLGSGGISALDVLTDVSNAVPAGMFIDVRKFALTDDGKAVVQANVDSYQDADKLVAALKQVPIFSNVESSDAGTDATGKKKMNIKFDVAPSEGGS
jgi:type II secretion system protein L